MLRLLLVGFVGCLACLATASEHQNPAHPPHWSYDKADGPARWGELHSDWAICASGRSQSPIDLRDTTPGASAGPLAFSNAPTRLTVAHQTHVVDALDNGHTIQVTMDVGDTLHIGEKDFQLLQYHFHSPSEHTVEGRHFPMEMHMVHRNDAGDLAVIGVLVEAGEHNAAFDAVWENLPDTPGEEVHLENVDIDVDDLLPRNLRSWRYRGSLTTPPCSESVQWIVLQEPIELDLQQIDKFRKIFPHNNRPVQPLFGRTVISAPTMAVD